MINLQTTKGYVSPIDCFIRINDILTEPGDGENLTDFTDRFSKADTSSTFAHEFVHYFQFLGTPVGYTIRLRQQWYTAMLLEFLKYLSQPVTLGQLRFGPEQTERRHKIQQNLDVRNRELRIFYRATFGNNASVFFMRCFPGNCGDAYQYLRQSRPIDIDLERMCFFLKDDPNITVDVSANCIMEYMARLVQLKFEGKLKSQEAVFEACRDERYASYHIPLIFLVQEGALEVPLWHILIYQTFMAIMHVSLLINPLLLTEQRVQEQSMCDANRYLPETLFLRCLNDPDLSNPFMLLLNIFNPQSKEKHKMNPRRYCDLLLETFRWPSIDTILRWFQSDVDEDKQLAINGGTSAGHRRASEFDASYTLCAKVWNNEEAILAPQLLMNDMPRPNIIMYYGDTFEAIKSDSWDFNSESLCTLAFHIGQKISGSEDLSCHWSNDSHESLIRCQFFSACKAQRNKRGLGFCKNKVWLETVTNFLKVTGLAVEL
jgi:hypothetical protein